MYGTTNGKIICRKGKGYYSYNFIVAKNYRNSETRKVGYQVVFNFGTIRDYEFADRAETFWQEVETELTALVRDNKIYSNDADKIRGQFQKYIPVSVAPTAAPVPVKTKINKSVAARLRARFGSRI